MNFDLIIFLKSWPIFGIGVLNTLPFCAASVPIGLTLAFLIFLMRSSHAAWLNVISSSFVGVIRDTPFLVQVYLVFYALPRLGVTLSTTTTGVTCLSAYAAAYFSESIRGAIASVPRGQMDAANALGMPYLLGIRRIILPQALGYLIPALTNQSIALIKESAILAVITVPEITMSAQIVMGFTFSPVEAYTAAALLYWILTALIAFGSRRWERRTLGRGAHRPGEESLNLNR